MILLFIPIILLAILTVLRTVLPVLFLYIIGLIIVGCVRALFYGGSHVFKGGRKMIDRRGRGGL